MQKVVKVLLCLLLFPVLTACQSGDSSVFLLPEDYTGYVIVIYGQERGVSKRYIDNKRLYNISKTGILKTQFEHNPGWTEFPEFYYGNIAPENKIEYVPYPSDDTSISEDSITVSGGMVGGANRDHSGKEVIRYVKYYVGTKQQMIEAHKQAETLNIVEISDRK